MNVGVVSIFVRLQNEASNFSHSHTFRQNKTKTNELYKQENENRKLKIQQPSLSMFVPLLPGEGGYFGAKRIGMTVGNRRKLP